MHRHHSASPRRPRGLSLIELLIVLAVVGLLAAVAVPGYQNYLQRSRRSDALAALYQLQQAQLRYRGFHPAYAASLAELGANTARVSAQNDYQLETGLASGGVGFYLRASARPDGRQADDHDCLVLTLTQQNHSTQLTPAACWGR